jgi:hypothetical protein
MIALIGIMGRLLGRYPAKLFREDLATKGFGTGWCGFALDLSACVLSPGQGYEIIVRREGDGAHLPGSPYVLKPGIRLIPGR